MSDDQDREEVHSTDLRSDDHLQESASDWVPIVSAATALGGVGVAGAKVASDHLLGRQSNQTARDRLEFERQQYINARAADESDDAA